MKKTDTTLQIKKFIQTRREKVYRAWTHPDLIKKWFAPGEMTTPLAEADATPGGQYRISMLNDKNETCTTHGQYLEIIPNEKLVFTWGWEGPNYTETLVTIEFHDKDNGTEITLTHERFTNAGEVERHAQGWQGCLANLENRITNL